MAYVDQLALKRFHRLHRPALEPPALEPPDVRCAKSSRLFLTYSTTTPTTNRFFVLSLYFGLVERLTLDLNIKVFDFLVIKVLNSSYWFSIRQLLRALFFSSNNTLEVSI